MTETLEEMEAKCEELTRQIDAHYGIRRIAQERIRTLTERRNKIWQESFKPWVGKTFKRNENYAIVSDVPQPYSNGEINFQQLPVMMFVYSPHQNIDVRSEPEELGLMWPDTIFRGDMPDTYNTDGTFGFDEDVWQEISPEEWSEAFNARVNEVARDLQKKNF